MRAKEFIIEAVGRSMQHVEDIIYAQGPDDAIAAADRLLQLGKNSKEMTIKFDGSPAVVFGRDEQGRFHYGDKHAKAPIYSADEIAKTVMNRAYAGKGDPAIDANRQQFAAGQAAIWKLYESATPKDFRGFVEGDLMWSAPPQLADKEYVVKPNTVTYYIHQDSDLGKAMQTSKTGIALHFYKPAFDAPTQPMTPEILNRLGNANVVVMGPKATIEVQASVDAPQIKELKQLIRKSKKSIEAFLAPESGLTNVAATIYTYVNSNADQAGLDHYLNWAKEKLSKTQLEKVLAKDRAGLNAIFEIMHRFVKIKVDIINQVEGPGLKGLGIRAMMQNTGDVGGEGLVDTGSEQPLKFVNRATFSRANRMGR